mmetsp:Transcript_34346/g.96829  ORF Transcript_34346/g.96829 Transcript_34346/m.96829 type:complete len:309 (-) Transcript_34346:564-1490(-)
MSVHLAHAVVFGLETCPEAQLRNGQGRIAASLEQCANLGKVYRQRRNVPIKNTNETSMVRVKRLNRRINGAGTPDREAAQHDDSAVDSVDGGRVLGADSVLEGTRQLDVEKEVSGVRVLGGIDTDLGGGHGQGAAGGRREHLEGLNWNYYLLHHMGTLVLDVVQLVQVPAHEVGLAVLAKVKIVACLAVVARSRELLPTAPVAIHELVLGHGFGEGVPVTVTHNHAEHLLGPLARLPQLPPLEVFVEFPQQKLQLGGKVRLNQPRNQLQQLKFVKLVLGAAGKELMDNLFHLRLEPDSKLQEELIQRE